MLELLDSSSLNTPEQLGESSLGLGNTNDCTSEAHGRASCHLAGGFTSRGPYY
jgi:hypothetical protein